MPFFTGKTKKQSGFTISGLLVVIVIIGILAPVAVPRFIGSQDRVRVSAARADVDQFRQALAMYEIDWVDFPAAMTLETAPEVLMDPNRNPYMTLPTGTNFVKGSFAYTYVDSGRSSYSLQVTALDNAGTVLTGTPDGVQ